MDEASVKTAETATKIAPQLPTTAAPVSGYDLLANVGMSFLFVIFLILLLAWLVKRSGFRRLSNGLITIRDSYAISAKERILMIEIDNRLLMVGVTAQQMTLLYTVDPETTKTMLTEELTSAPSPINSTFQQILKASFKRKK